MLAQNFKTANELGIHERMYQALIKVLGMLEREEIPSRLFTMKRVGQPECGTPGCILGWALSIDKDLVGSRSRGNSTSKVSYLFYPIVNEAFDANREQAATVLRAYLNTGKIPWKEVMEA